MIADKFLVICLEDWTTTPYFRVKNLRLNALDSTETNSLIVTLMRQYDVYTSFVES